MINIINKPKIQSFSKKNRLLILNPNTTRLTKKESVNSLYIEILNQFQNNKKCGNSLMRIQNSFSTLKRKKIKQCRLAQSYKAQKIYKIINKQFQINIKQMGKLNKNKI